MPLDRQKQKRNEQPLFVPVQTWSDEPPHLIRHERRRDDQAAHQRQIEVEREAFARSRVDQRRIGRDRRLHRGEHHVGEAIHEHARDAMPAAIAAHARMRRVRSSSRCSRNPMRAPSPSRSSSSSEWCRWFDSAMARSSATGQRGNHSPQFVARARDVAVASCHQSRPRPWRRLRVPGRPQSRERNDSRRQTRARWPRVPEDRSCARRPAFGAARRSRREPPA